MSRIRHRTGRRTAGVVLAGLVAAGLTPGSASALAGAVPIDSWQTNGRVAALVQVGDTVYLGGSFSQVHDGNGASAARGGLAAIDLIDGAPTSWNPSVDGDVLALAASPDGNTIYAGGVFDEIDGHVRHNLAAIDAGSGAVLDWTSDASAGVRSLDADAKRVYAGGAFSSIGGVFRSKLAALRATTGQAVPDWGPGSINGTVRAVELAGSRLVVGGSFSTVGGSSRRSVMSVRKTTGELEPWADPPNSDTIALSVDPADPRHVYAGNRANEITKYVVRRGDEIWEVEGNGDVQAVQVLDGVVYGGGHFDNFDGQSEPKLVALSENGGHLTWNASANSATGVFAFAAGSHLSVGGDFTRVTGLDQQGFAAFDMG